ncbi:MAG: PUR family DNA/RNA-binding protein [Paludibacteraceae bacterium]|nr:PUR family DNA/RNA-binding protein [Paludibacteraceae bacterium]
MENRRFDDKKEPEIVYSHSVKAGKRIYYLDVKKARNEDLYLCITESKKKQGMEDESPMFEKHKVFLYREDFDHFKEALQDVIGFVEDKLGKMEARPEWNPEAHEDATASEAAEDEPKKKGLFGRFMKD